MSDEEAASQVTPSGRYAALVGEVRSVRFHNQALLADRARIRTSVLAAVAKFREDLGWTAPELLGMRLAELDDRIRAALADEDPLATHAHKRAESQLWENYSFDTAEDLRAIRATVHRLLTTFEVAQEEAENLNNAASPLPDDEVGEVADQETGADPSHA